MSEKLVSNNVIIVVSRKDIAGMNMLKFLLDRDEFKEESIDVPDIWPSGAYELYHSDKVSLLVIPDDQIFTDYFRGYIDTDLMIFASKHKSAAGKKALLVHTTGNWNEEQGHGGSDHQIAYAPSDVLTYAYNCIKRLQEGRGLDEYWTGIECTHHGPTSLEYPIAYFETGGTEEEWNDLDSCKLIADVIWLTLETFLNGGFENRPVFIGIGGNHYCSSFIKLLDEENVNFGHIIPKYAHKLMPTSMLKSAYEKTKGDNKIFVFDKKGIRADSRDKFIEFIEENNWEWKYL